MMRRFFHIILVIGVIGCSQSNEEILLDYLEHRNQHNINKSLSYLSDDIRFELIGVWIKTGLSDLRELEIWDKSMNTALDFEIAKTIGDTIICIGTERNDWFSALDMEFVEYESVTFIFEKGKIREIIAKPDPTFTQRIIGKMQDVQAWTKENNDDTLRKLLPGGRFTYSKESAEMWLDLLQRWNESKSEKDL